MWWDEINRHALCEVCNFRGEHIPASRRVILIHHFPGAWVVLMLAPSLGSRHLSWKISEVLWDGLRLFRLKLMFCIALFSMGLFIKASFAICWLILRKHFYRDAFHNFREGMPVVGFGQLANDVLILKNFSNSLFFNLFELLSVLDSCEDWATFLSFLVVIL